jgi:hypothetical protein
MATQIDPLVMESHWPLRPKDKINSVKYHLGLVWLPLFWARIKEFICDSRNYLFGCHGIGYRIHFEFHDFHPMHNLNTYVVSCHFCGFAK